MAAMATLVNNATARRKTRYARTGKSVGMIEIRQPAVAS
jgi:hypothetical protein